MEEKYLDLSAICDVSVTEMLQRFLCNDLPGDADKAEEKEGEND